MSLKSSAIHFNYLYTVCYKWYDMIKVVLNQKRLTQTQCLFTKDLKVARKPPFKANKTKNDIKPSPETWTSLRRHEGGIDELGVFGFIQFI